jgi:hypothetical protein
MPAVQLPGHGETHAAGTDHRDVDGVRTGHDPT